MKTTLLIILIICITVWLTRTYKRNKGYANCCTRGGVFSNLLYIWYDSTNGKLSLRKEFQQAATITIKDSYDKIIIEKEFPKDDKFFKIPVRGELQNGIYSVNVVSQNFKTTSRLQVKGCAIKILYKNHP